jgi:hypothetical protein
MRAELCDRRIDQFPYTFSAQVWVPLAHHGSPGETFLKQCTNCQGNLADFVPVCPYCGVSQPVPQAAMAQPEWSAPSQTSNKAVASLICGVILCFVPSSIAAVILGHLALSDIKRSAGRMAGQGMAVAGLVMGYIGIVFTAIFAIAIVFTMRNTLRHDVPGNESAAVQTMKTYDQALKAYAAKCPQQGYPTSLVRLGPGRGDCSRANLVEMRLAVVRPARLGYVFSYNPGIEGKDHVTVFALVASPVQPGLTGKRYFYLDDGGIIRQANSRIIGPRSDPVDGAQSEQGSDQNQDEKEDD